MGKNTGGAFWPVYFGVFHTVAAFNGFQTLVNLSSDLMLLFSLTESDFK